MANSRQGIFKKLAGLMIRLFLLLVTASVLQVLALKFINPPGTVNMVYEWVLGTWFDKPYVKSVYIWKDLDEISVYLKQAVMASEDQRFLSHNGFDFMEIRNVIDDIMAHRGYRGASTITMQAARSLFLPSSRSMLRKLAEAWYTVLMELIWDKPRIFEIYLNTVDWGTGTVGAQAGARAYFSQDASQLSPGQAALMAAVLPSPHKWSARAPGPYVKKRMQRIMGQMGAMPRL